jgi:hypothetical protein
MSEQIVYWILEDDSGTAWYVYPNTDSELVITDAAPTDETGWYDYFYASNSTISTAGSGIKYVTLSDSGSTSWYIYPNSDGELIITTTEPS